jgi:hypothetical protein
MPTDAEIDQVIKEARIDKHGPSIDFDWFDTVVEAASNVDVIQEEVEVVPAGMCGDGFLLILIVDGNRLSSNLLTFEELWSEDYHDFSSTQVVTKMLEIASLEISKITLKHRTWFTPRPIGT